MYNINGVRLLDCMGVGREGQGPPRILKILAKKVFF